MRIGFAGLACLGLLAGCGEQAAGLADKATTATVATPAAPLATHIAFTFALHFRLPAAALDDVQQDHEDACESLGSSRCIVLSSTLEGRDGKFGRGTLTVLAAPESARALTRRFGAIVGQAEGSLVRSQMEGEALDQPLAAADDALTSATATRTDAEATLAAGRGTLNRLDASRDAATQRTAEAEAATSARTLRGRLAASRITVAYESELPVNPERGRPLAEAWASALTDLSASLAVLLQLLVIAGPFAAAAILALLGWRRWERRRIAA